MANESTSPEDGLKIAALTVLNWVESRFVDGIPEGFPKNLPKVEEYKTVDINKLKIGNRQENLLRIYFLIDQEKQLIVIGSMPEHLSTITRYS